ncbi:MAG: translation initiation factor [Sediminibacterium sp.]|jgi:translation initiation factor 1|nr:translation initiation factor [Sediminibacterium sp.]MBP6145081.1 translation initiation factor [Sediminibacterium sp.]
MSKKPKNTVNSFSSIPLVYSTNPDYMVPNEAEEKITLAPAEQLLRVILETKHRAGKTVTIVYGFEGADTDLEALGKALKNFCGTGGSVKDGEMIIQGDHRQKVFQYLKQKGYNKAKL